MLFHETPETIRRDKFLEKFAEEQAALRAEEEKFNSLTREELEGLAKKDIRAADQKQFFADVHSLTSRWMLARPAYIACPENLSAMQGELQLYALVDDKPNVSFVTLDRAFDTLVEQGRIPYRGEFYQRHTPTASELRKLSQEQLRRFEAGQEGWESDF